MYYLIFTLLYLLSLLPFWLLYAISNGLAFILGSIFKYRADVIDDNIKKAFPSASDEFILKTRKQFYKNFTASFVETIKLLSMSRATFAKRAIVDVTAAQHALSQGQRVILMASHLFGWEYCNSALGEKLSSPFVGVYMKVNRQSFERIMIRIRTRFGGFLVSVYDLPKQLKELDEKKVVLGLMADQRPLKVDSAYWLYFFGKPAPFSAAPEKMAQKNAAAVYFLRPTFKKRGFYHFETILLCADGAQTERGEVTRIYRDILEQSILEQPANYLWSHKRWKSRLEKKHLRKWIDLDAPPAIVP